jgi:hypothetical protein
MLYPVLVPTGFSLFILLAPPADGDLTCSLFRLPTTVAWVRSCGICGQSGTGAGFLGVLKFPLPIIPPTAPHSSSIIWGWYKRPVVDSVPPHPKGGGGGGYYIQYSQTSSIHWCYYYWQIVILDEATASVDPETEVAVQTTVQREFKHCTILTIAHRLSTVTSCDRVLVMKEGQVWSCSYWHYASLWNWSSHTGKH